MSIHLEPGDARSEPGLHRVEVGLLLTPDEMTHLASYLDTQGWHYEAHDIGAYLTNDPDTYFGPWTKKEQPRV